MLEEEREAQCNFMPGSLGTNWLLLTPFSPIFLLFMSSLPSPAVCLSLLLSFYQPVLVPISRPPCFVLIPLPSLTVGGGKRSDFFLQNPLPFPPEYSGKLLHYHKGKCSCSCHICALCSGLQGKEIAPPSSVCLCLTRHLPYHGQRSKDPLWDRIFLSTESFSACGCCFLLTHPLTLFQHAHGKLLVPFKESSLAIAMNF